MVRTRTPLIPLLLTMLLMALGSGPTLAAKPDRPGRPAPTSPPPDSEEPPLTAEQEAASDAKIASAEAYLASVDAAGLELSSLNCVTPTGMAELTVGGASTDATIDACYVPQGFLAVEARDQLKGIYCGPAVGQVISNYSWAMGSGANKFTQDKIAGWMATNTYGGTSAEYLERGLEQATLGSPRRPGNWNWVVSYLRDLNGNGDTGDELHGYIRSNVSSSRMPLAIPVKPHDPNSTYYLSSWPKAVWSPGHWIAAYGWVSYYTGTDYARTYYTDSSRDEGGSTGKFWDPTRHIARLIAQHTGRFVW
jgi:hypothetical protein